MLTVLPCHYSKCQAETKDFVSVDRLDTRTVRANSGRKVARNSTIAKLLIRETCRDGKKKKKKDIVPLTPLTFATSPEGGKGAVLWRGGNGGELDFNLGISRNAALVKRKPSMRIFSFTIYLIRKLQ